MENTSDPLDLRDLTSLADCRQVVEVQHEVWGLDDETVPASLLLASVKSGGILVGAFEGERLTGFVWSMPAWRDEQRTHWSHMLAVLPRERHRGLGEQLKLAQRDRALAQGVQLMEWTFDPLQAVNAHLNLARLGAVASLYVRDMYGDSPSPLHAGTPTDRLIAQWRLDEPRADHGVRKPVAELPRIIDTRQVGEWMNCGDPCTTLDAARLTLPIPPRFAAMQQEARPTALAWRLATRAAFTAYFARGYRAVDFVLNRKRGGGSYLLTQEPRT